ncbi:MAG: ABC transporter ATP-binding protein [Candidatus Moranbacteria bacterium]|jgi:putative ABC transport system ATP-binding protein|nr:ABC transporter ATP-binding protein [Candidatus Moranbacteria bacterium]
MSLPLETPPPTPILSIRGVSKRYLLDTPNPICALDDISFDIYQGEFLAIIGRSGSGKSTLLNLIGLLDLPTSGDILISDRNLTRLSEQNQTRYRLQFVSFVFQAFNLLDQFTSMENIAIQLELQGMSTSRAKQEALEILRYLGLENRAGRYPRELSGGEQQRIAIGRAIAKNSRLILADEPTAHLDTANAKNVIALLRDVRDRLGKTIVLVTHEPEQTKAADRVITLNDGKLVSQVGKNIGSAVS